MFDDWSRSYDADLLVDGLAAVDHDQGRNSPYAVTCRGLASYPAHHVKPDNLSLAVQLLFQPVNDGLSQQAGASKIRVKLQHYGPARTRGGFKRC